VQALLVLSLWSLIVAADIKYRRIPKRLNFALIALLLPAGWAICLTAGLVWFVYLTIYRLSAGAIGYGDVRLAPATGHFLIGGDLNFTAIFAPHCLAWCGGGGLALLIRRRGAQSLPFAPFLFFASLIYQASAFIFLR